MVLYKTYHVAVCKIASHVSHVMVFRGLQAQDDSSPVAPKRKRLKKARLGGEPAQAT